jgi:hypothetical protein
MTEEEKNLIKYLVISHSISLYLDIAKLQLVWLKSILSKF